MKIVYCIPSLYNSGGMERILTLKANYLSERFGWEVVIITSCQKKRKPFFELSPKVRLIDLAVDYEALPSNQILGKLLRKRILTKKHKRALTEVLIKEKADIVVSMYTHELAFLPSIKDGSKKVLEIHFSKNYRLLDAISNQRSFFVRGLNILLDYCEHKAVRKYDKFIVLTEKDAKAWGVVYRNLAVVPNPTTFIPERYSETNAKRAVAVGRLCPQKGFDTLISAWALIPNHVRAGWYLDIIGGGPDYQKLMALIKSKGLTEEITLRSPVPNLQSELYRYSIFCFSSRYEGFGLSLIEAMTTGLACVAFDCPCGPSDMIENNLNGLLVEEQDNVELLAKNIARLMSDSKLRGSLGHEAIKTVADKFTVDIIMSEWYKIFTDLKEDSNSKKPSGSLTTSG